MAIPVNVKIKFVENVNNIIEVRILKKYKGIGVIVIIVAISIFAIFSYVNGGKDSLNKNNTESIFVESEEVVNISNNVNEIVVEIKGEVVNPNIYWMREDSIIQDLIDKAGGLTSNAEISGINRAELLSNHSSIIIPNKNSNESSSIDIKENVQNKDGKININTANESELDSLPGIGKSKAEAIIKYREDNGKFKSIEDIKNVSGIGESAFEKIKEKITI